MFETILTNAMNAYLKLDPESSMRLQGLDGRIVSIELLPFQKVFQCRFTATGVSIHQDAIYDADVTISGTPWQLANVMLRPGERQTFFADDVRMEGNAELGQQVTELFDALHIDWEEALSQLVGDVPAYHAGRMMATLKAWWQDARQHITRDVNDYVHEEVRLFPPKGMLEEFYTNIDALRMAVDRMDARIQRLQTELDREE